MSTTTIPTNLSVALEYFDEQTSEVDVWLVVSLSAISIFIIISFTAMHIVVQVEARDHAKETKKMAFKKLFRNEYLVFSYCLSLLMSHSINVFHKLALKYHFSLINSAASSHVNISSNCSSNMTTLSHDFTTQTTARV